MQGTISINLTGEIKKTDGSADLIMIKDCPEDIPDNVSFIVPYKIWSENRKRDRLFPLFSPETFHESKLQIRESEYFANTDPDF